MTEAEQTSTTLMQAWAEEVQSQVTRVREARERDEADLRAAEYGEDWSPDDQTLERNFRRLWAASHQLVWSAFQLERWSVRVALERGHEPPRRDIGLANLRNALEHLDEAELDEIYARAGENDRKNRSLRTLPGGELLIGTSGRLLFGLMDPEDIERRALAILGAIEDEFMAGAEAWTAD